MTKHPAEMSNEVLLALGFRLKHTPEGTERRWTHPRNGGKYYCHIMTPGAVEDALIQIGRREFRLRAEAEIASIDMEVI